jgi:hypothetical protein
MAAPKTPRKEPGCPYCESPHDPELGKKFEAGAIGYECGSVLLLGSGMWESRFTFLQPCPALTTF